MDSIQFKIVKNNIKTVKIAQFVKMDSTDNTMKMIMTTVLLVTLVHVNYVNLLMDGSDHLVQNVQKTIILFQSD